MPKFRIMIPRHDYYIVDAEDKVDARRKLEGAEDRADYFDDAEEDYDRMEINGVTAPMFSPMWERMEEGFQGARQVREPFPKESIRILPA